MTKLFLTTLLTASAVTMALADHGPGTSGSGVNTESAEILKPRQWSATLNFDWTEFDVPAESTLLGKDHFDLIDRSFLTTLSVGVGITENFQLSLAFGYYAAEGTREIAHGHGEGAAPEHAEEAGAEEGEHHEEETPTAEKPEFDTFDADGWTDLWLKAKYRLYRGPLGQVALFGGVKFPIGDDRVFNSAGERVEPASTPGSGAWDGLIGAAYTQSLTPSVAVDASAQYIVRGEKHDYRLGNRFDAGVALGWRFIGSAQSFPQVSLQAEATVRSVTESKSLGERDPNTGGTVLFLSPGVRVRLCENAAWSVGMQFPVVQELNGDQVETDFRLTSSVNISF